MNAFLVAAVVYLLLTLAGVGTPWREVYALVAFIAEVLGNQTLADYHRLKLRISNPHV